MIVVLMRHARAIEALPGLADADRWITGKGRKASRKVSAWLAKPKRRPLAIRTSPLVRAVQTAEILADACEMTEGVEVWGELSPGRDPGDLLRVLAAHEGPSPIALVGHEPSLSLIATSLLSDPWPGLRKSGLLAVEWSGSGKAERLYTLDPAEL